MRPSVDQLAPGKLNHLARGFSSKKLKYQGPSTHNHSCPCGIFFTTPDLTSDAPWYSPGRMGAGNIHGRSNGLWQLRTHTEPSDQDGITADSQPRPWERLLTPQACLVPGDKPVHQRDHRAPNEKGPHRLMRPITTLAMLAAPAIRSRNRSWRRHAHYPNALFLKR